MSVLFSVSWFKVKLLSMHALNLPALPGLNRSCSSIFNGAYSCSMIFRRRRREKKLMELNKIFNPYKMEMVHALTKFDADHWLVYFYFYYLSYGTISRSSGRCTYRYALCPLATYRTWEYNVLNFIVILVTFNLEVHFNNSF